MQLYTRILHKETGSIDSSAPAGAKSEFRSRHRSRHFLRHTALAALCALALSSPSHAQQPDAAPGAAESAGTRVEVDQEAGVTRFFIDDEKKARLDAAGLHVRENIDYGGAGFDDRAGWKELERLKAPKTEEEGRDAP